MIKAIKHLLRRNKFGFKPFWSVPRPVEFTRVFQRLAVVERPVQRAVIQPSWLSQFGQK